MASLGSEMKTVFWMGLGALVLAWFIYLVSSGAKHKTQVFLFWSICVTMTISLLVGMGIDSVSLAFHPLAAGRVVQKAPFRSDVPQSLRCPWRS